MRHRARRFIDSLRGKSVILVLLAMVLGVSTVAVIGALRGRALLRGQAQEQLRQVARIAREELDSKIQTRFTAVTRAAGGLRTSESAFLRQAPSLFDRHSVLNSLFDSVLVYDARGRVIADFPREGRIGQDVSGCTFFKQVSRELTTVVSAPFITKRNPHPAIELVAPVFNPNGHFIGAIAGSIDLTDEGVLGNLQNVRLGQSGYLMVATRDGRILSGPGPGLVADRLPRLPSLRSALMGREGIFEGNGLDGRDSLFAVSQMTQAPWFVAAVRPLSEALAPFWQFTRDAVLTSLLALLLLAPIAWWLFDRLLQPLEDLETQIRDRHKGRRRTPVSIAGSEEVRSVADVFNQVYQDRTRALDRLAEREAFFRSLTESAPLGIVQTDRKGVIQFANPAFGRILGVATVALKGQPWLDSLAADDRDRVEDEWAQARAGGRTLATHCRLRSPGRGEVWVDAIASRIDRGDRLLGYIAVVRDISRERQIEAQLEEERIQAESVLGALQEAVVVTGNEGVIHFCNPPALKFLGKEEDVIGKPLFDMVRVQCEGRVLDLESFRDRADVRNLDVIMTNARGEKLDLELTMLRLDDSRQNETRLVFVLQDDSERRQHEARLSWEATHDPLTGLVNRRAFMASLVHWLGEARERSRESVLALIDLDHFKVVNDQGGHLLGDELLRRLAGRLKEQVRQTDIAARLGGDEFALLLPGCNQERALEILEQVRRGIAELRLRDENRHYGVTASIGVTVVSAGDENPRATLSRADRGCYAVKAEGRNGVRLVPAPDSDPTAGSQNG